MTALSTEIVIALGLAGLATLVLIAWSILSLIWLCERINHAAENLVLILSSTEKINETLDDQTALMSRRIGGGKPPLTVDPDATKPPEKPR
jgi:hypothetical protein